MHASLQMLPYALSSLITDRFIVYVLLALCPDPPGIDHGEVTFTGNSIGDNATYTCNSGFKLVGPPVTVCSKLPNFLFLAFFQPEAPTCQRKYCMNIY